MSQTPSSPKPVVATYIWSIVILALVASGLIMGILIVRPASDPMLVIAGVLTALTPTTAAVLAFLKAQETHLSVNSRLDAFMAEHGKASRAEGLAEGVLREQARIRDEKAVAALLPPVVIKTEVVNEATNPIPTVPVVK